MTATLRITRRASDRLRAGHLWVYRSDIEQPRDAPPVRWSLSRHPRDSARYRALSTASQIAARLVSRNPSLTRDSIRSSFASASRPHWRFAVNWRRSPQRTMHTASSSPRPTTCPASSPTATTIWSSLQLLTQGTAQDDVRDTVVLTLREHLQATLALTICRAPRSAHPRTRAASRARRPGPLFTTAATPDAPTTTTFTLNGLRFHYDASAGQKTGAFLDQRLNYAAAAHHVLASGRTSRESARGLRALISAPTREASRCICAQVCSKVTGIDSQPRRSRGRRTQSGSQPALSKRARSTGSKPTPSNCCAHSTTRRAIAPSRRHFRCNRSIRRHRAGPARLRQNQNARPKAPFAATKS